MEINNEEEEVLPLPKPRDRRGEIGVGLPPSSRDPLVNRRPVFKREIKEKKSEEKEKKKEEKKVQIVYMKPNGSFIFQTLMEFHQVYSIIYFIIEELLMAYKIHYFHIRPYAAGFEVTGLIFYLFIQFGRFYFGSLGNRAEASLFVIFCVAFSLGAIYTYIHYLRLQTYVLRVELITNSVGLFLAVLEDAFGIMAFLSISGKESGI